MLNINQQDEEDFYPEVRKNMIDCQLRPNGVFKEAIINAFERIPREIFVPNAQKSRAYSDESIYLKEKRFILSPTHFGKMLNESDISMNDNVLDVGCGNGYSSFILSLLCANITGVERYSSMVKKAQNTIETCPSSWGVNKANFCFFHSKLDGSKLEDCSKYDLIFLEGLVKKVPKAYRNLLSNNGRLMCFERDEYGRMFCMKYIKIGQSFSGTPVFSANVPTLISETKQAFEF